MPDTRKYIDPDKLADTPLNAAIELDDIHPDLRLDFTNADEAHHTPNTPQD